MSDAIYEPKGRAFEYAKLAVNLYRGCYHRCEYCFVPNMLRMSREKWLKRCQDATPVPDILTLVERDAKRYVGTRKRVLLCFTSDPYQPIAIKSGITSATLELLIRYDIPFVVLTKAGSVAAKDFGKYRPCDRYAVTLSFITSDSADQWEPFAVPPAWRIASLEMAKHSGIKTWLSMEPVIYPGEALDVIDATQHCVDLFKIGKWNHDARAKEIDWRAFALEAIRRCERLGKPYYIKHDLRAFLKPAEFSNTEDRVVENG
jgi:DNA repair photolyase